MSFVEAWRQRKWNVKDEVLSGLTVSLALVPEVVAFSLLAHVSPLIGLHTAFIIALITAVVGGRPGMISGAAGAIAVVSVHLVLSHGLEYLFAAVVLMGIIQLLIGLLRFGKFIRLVPHPVIYGFVNGLAIIIFMAQLEQLKTVDATGNSHWLTGTALWIMLSFIALAMSIIYVLPKITKAFPPSLAAILIVSAIIIGFGVQTKSVGDFASIAGGLPQFHLPQMPISWDILRIIFPYSLLMALVGLIESLLTLTVVDELTQTRGRGNKECIAQGIGNVTTGFFGGMGGCAMIGQSIININSGGRERLSGVVAALSILLFVLFGSSIIEKVPMAALVGVMVMLSINTFEWASLKVFRKVPTTDVVVMSLVTIVTVISQNLAIAVIIGVVISALAFAWESAKRIRARKYIDQNGIKHYEIYGPLFFGSVATFLEKFTVANDPEEVIIDFKESRVVDHSAIEALNKITDRYRKAGKKLHLRHLSEDCQLLLNNAADIIDVNYWEDPHYKVMEMKLE